MLVGAICALVAIVAIARALSGRERPLDRSELRWLQRVADNLRREQCQPFE